MAAERESQVGKPVQVNKWDGSACKNAIDDSIKDALLTRYKYQECHRLIDGRLAICGIAVAVALFALVWDHFYPFPQSRPVLIFCVSTYFTLMGILTLYTTYKEKGIFVVAVQKEGKGSGNIWEASSFMTKFDDKYLLVLSLKDAKTGKVSETSVTRSVAHFIDEKGYIAWDQVDNEVVKLHNSLLSEKKEK